MDTYLSREGYEKLREEVERLKKMRSVLSKEIGEAAAKGDLKENAEYHSAKERQADVQRRIHETEFKLKGAKILDDLKVAQDEVLIGATVTIEEVGTKSRLTYTLVGADEADFSKNKISVFSPLVQGLLGHKVGDEAKVQLPAGPKTFKIIKIER